MFSVGEFIVHPGQGVCRVAEIESGTYKLEPVGQRHPMLISFPTANEDRLRPVISADEARSLIDGYRTLAVDGYTDRSAALEEGHFKEVLKQGSCEDAVRVVKTFRRRIEQVEGEGKHAPVVYERILKAAQGRSLSEIACALGTSADAVVELFRASAGEHSEDFASL